MSSQDTQSRAQSERETAQKIRKDIANHQSSFQQQMDALARQAKVHEDEAARLDQQAQREQQEEQKQLERERQEAEKRADAREVAKEVVVHNLF